MLHHYLNGSGKWQFPNLNLGDRRRTVGSDGIRAAIFKPSWDCRRLVAEGISIRGRKQAADSRAEADSGVGRAEAAGQYLFSGKCSL